MTRDYGKNADDELERADADLRAGHDDDRCANGCVCGGEDAYYRSLGFDPDELDDLDAMAESHEDDRELERERRFRR